MPLSTQDNRHLVPFLSAWDQEATITLTDLTDELLKPDSPGVLLHAGPGSGKTRTLKNLKQTIEEREGIALGHFDMVDYEGETQLGELLRDLAFRILEQIRAIAPSISAFPSDTANPSPTQIGGWVETGLRELSRQTNGRIVLLLDSYDRVHPFVAVRLAGFLRNWFEGHKVYFTFVLTAETDLEDLRAAESVYSPLRNICGSYLLQDFNQSQMTAYVRERTADWYVPLSMTELQSIWDQTLGYPSWVRAILAEMTQKRNEPHRQNEVEEAKKQCLRQHTRFEPLRTVIRRLEYLANMTPPELNPAKALDALQRGHRLSPNDRTTRLLLAMGILGWRGPQLIAWRNPMIQSFFGGGQDEQSEQLGETGSRLIASWLRRPVLFREGKLSAQGKVLVSLFIDLGPLLLPEEQKSFDLRRGTDEWRNRLLQLPELLAESGPFTLWRDQERLINTGNDLNLFREQAQRSFMPVYESKTDAESLKIDWDQVLSRFGQLPAEAQNKAVEILRHEWTRWQQVRVQLTRDGAAHIILVRAMDSPLPLMQLLDELLGLERELSGNNHVANLRQLSVQWEICLAILDAFFRQINHLSADLATNPDAPNRSEPYPPTAVPVPLLGITWNGLGPKTGQETALYPQRDRYVVFMLRKLCNCRAGGLRPPDEQRLITLQDDLINLFQDSPEKWEETEISYGREIACLLEGVMIRETNNEIQHQTSRGNDSSQSAAPEIGRFPSLKPREIHNMLCKDLASWQNELFVASLDNAIIIYQSVVKLPHSPTPAESKERPDLVCLVCRGWEKNIIEHLYFPQRTVSYEDYWQCVVLGLQYVIELRWATQWVARRITDDLADLADMMGQEMEKRASSEKINKLTQNVALTTRLLSHLRDASDPMSISSADYAARKYERVIEDSGLREMIKNAEKNSEAINAFLVNHSDQVLQKTTERLTKLVGLVGVFFTVLALLVTLPSMWVDFEGKSSLWELWVSKFSILSELGIANILCSFTALIFVSVIVGILFFVRPDLWDRPKRGSKH